MAGVGPIVMAEPQFIYPQQAEHDEDDRCSCVEVSDEDNDDPDREYPEEHFLYEDCPGTLTTTTPVVMFRTTGHLPALLGTTL